MMQKQTYLFSTTPRVFWLTGLSGAGKTSIGLAVQEKLMKKDYFSILLDGDEMRKTLSSDLGYTEEARKENVRRVAEVAHLMAKEGIIVLCAMMSPTVVIRETARHIIGENIFREIYIHASIETCIERDPKGLYKLNAEKKISHLSGIDSPFEAPENPFLTIYSDKKPKEDCIDELFYAILQEIQVNP